MKPCPFILMSNLILTFLVVIVLFISCAKKNIESQNRLKEIAEKANSAGYKVKYNDSLKIIKPDINKIADPKMLAQRGKCGLDDDTAFIKELERISQPSGNSQVKCMVPDAQTAIKLAIAAWEPVYGKNKVAKEKPYKAILKDNIWFVSGSLPYEMLGGVVEAEISNKTGNVLKVYHGK
jgi:hypothetical protein